MPCSMVDSRYDASPASMICRGPEPEVVQRRNGGTTQQFESAFHISPQDLKRSGHAGFAGGSEAVGIGASAENRFRAQADGLDDIGAAPNSAVHQHFHLTVHRRDHFGKRSQ